MNNNKYPYYSVSEIDELISEPWEVSDQPYKLHAAFAISCLFELIAPGPDEDDDIPQLWGMTVPKSMIDRLAKEVQEDFVDAAESSKPIKVFGRSYSIRKRNAFDPARLHLIFDFPVVHGDCYEVDQSRILNLMGRPSPLLDPYTESKMQMEENRTYLRQIIMMAEDDKGDGWDKLTDMEIVLYCWAQYYNKYQTNNFIEFKNKYKDYIYMPESEIEACYNKNASLRNMPCGMYTFSRSKIQEWNEKHRQLSEASKIPPSEADDYWYDVALKNTFKPIDFK